jgi:glutathione peroxidase-family protein
MGNGEVSHSLGAFTEVCARTNAGEEVAFSDFRDKVILAVNVARL